jgi:hypothetical protein
MIATKTVHPNLVRAYREAIYIVNEGDDAIALKVGEASPALAALMHVHKATTAAILTAYNPYSEIQPSAENERMQASLVAELKATATLCFDAIGSDPEGEWEPEASTLALGISLGVDRLFYGLQELGLVASRSSPTQVLVTVFDDTVRARSYAIAQTLRSAGFSVEVFLGAGKLKKQFTYADRKQIPWVVVAGPDELARDEATLKNLRTGEQHVLPILALAVRLRQP